MQKYWQANLRLDYRQPHCLGVKRPTAVAILFRPPYFHGIHYWRTDLAFFAFRLQQDPSALFIILTFFLCLGMTSLNAWNCLQEGKSQWISLLLTVLFVGGFLCATWYNAFWARAGSTKGSTSAGVGCLLYLRYWQLQQTSGCLAARFFSIGRPNCVRGYATQPS